MLNPRASACVTSGSSDGAETWYSELIPWQMMGPDSTVLSMWITRTRAAFGKKIVTMENLPAINGSLLPQHGLFSGCSWRNGPQIWVGYGRQLWIYQISSCTQPTRGGPPAWGWAKCWELLAIKTYHFTRPQSWSDHLVWHKQWKRDMWFQDLGTDENIILKLILKKWGGGHWLDWSGSG